MAINDITTKICIRCKESKELSSFHLHKRMADGRINKCKVCVVAYIAEWRINNPDCRKIEYAKGDGAKRMAVGLKKSPNGAGIDKAKKRKASLKYYYANKEKCRDSARRWAKSESGKVKIIEKRIRLAHLYVVLSRSRQIKKLNATPAWVNRFVIHEAYHLAKLRQIATGIKWHVDHIVPIKSNLVCGLHCEHNIQVIPAIKNILKSNKFWPHMP